jgi:hypothetical protein
MPPAQEGTRSPLASPNHDDHSTSSQPPTQQYHELSQANATAATTTGANSRRMLTCLFSSCQEDPVASIHMLWNLTVAFILIFFLISIFESTYNMGNYGCWLANCGNVWKSSNWRTQLSCAQVSVDTIAHTLRIL